MKYNPAINLIHQYAAMLKKEFNTSIINFVKHKVGALANPPVDVALESWLAKFIMPSDASKAKSAIRQVPRNNSPKAETRVAHGQSLAESVSVVIETKDDSSSEDEEEETEENDERDGGESGSSAVAGAASSRDTYPAPIGFCRQDSTEMLMSLERKYGEADPTAFYTGDDLDAMVVIDGDVDADCGVRRPITSLMGCMMTGPDSDGTATAAGGGSSLPNADVNLKISQQNSVPSAAEPEKSSGLGSLVSAVPFGTPVLGEKGANALMHELSKAAFRFKEDLFVLSFGSPPLAPGSAVVSRADRQALESWLEASGLDANRFYSVFSSLPSFGDTKDPDELAHSPLVDLRQTFLEMCQYRHYQFDSLRRAKHSSMMLLYHLHRPYQKSLRPTCASCAATIRDVRWHCELCSDFDLCCICMASTIGAQHPHPLTPFRVTYH